MSVVIVTYNRAGLLRETVDSVLGQTYKNLELIVVDDGSDDETLDMLAGYEDERLQVLPLEHCGVLGRSKNSGVAAGRGDLVAFLDSDDVWLPDKLERQVAVLERNPLVGLVCSNAHVIDDDGVDLGTTYLPAGVGASGEVLEELLDTNFVIGSSAIVRRTLYEQVGRFSEAPELRPADDYDLWLRVAAISEVVYLTEPLLQYREHRGSMRRGVPRYVYWTAMLLTVNNLGDFLAPDDIRRRSLVRPRRTRLLVQLAGAQRREVGVRVAARSVGQALRNDPGAALTLSLLPVRRRLGQIKILAGSLRWRDGSS